jgi:hypothetical protein
VDSRAHCSKRRATLVLLVVGAIHLRVVFLSFSLFVLLS